MRNTDIDGAVIVTEKLRSRIAEEAFGKPPDTFSITVSIGVADLEYLTEDSFEKSYQCVDKALYQAKGTGKNCFVVYEQS